MSQQTQPYARTGEIIYTVPGMWAATLWNSPLGILEWSADGRIRLYKVDKDSRQVSGVEFDVAPNEIISVQANEPVGFSLKLGNGKYYFTFSRTGMAPLAAGGVLGIAASDAIYRKTGADWWVKSLQEVGVQSQMSTGRLGTVLGIALAILLVGGMLLAALIYQIIK